MPKPSRQRYQAASSSRHLVLARGPAIAAAAGLAALSIWSAGSAWFILARDDIAQRVFARDAEATYAYEDRIKRLQDDLQREVTRNLVEHDGVAGRIERIATRQAELEAQQVRLGRLAERDTLTTGSIAPARPAQVPHRPGATAELGAAADGARSASEAPAPPLGLRLGRDDAASAPPTAAAERPRDRLSLVEQSMQSVAVAQVDLLGRLRLDLDGRISGLRSAVAAAGLDLDRLSGTARPGLGGPLVALPPGMTTAGFGPLASALESERSEYSRLLGVTRRLPLGRPLSELEQTSPFGYRYDPFTRAPALHTGTDFRAEWGTAVRATAAGRVTAAEMTGGYGNMVEIDHGGGLVTRYGHLSGYLVSPGDPVEAGQSIGRVGSTGRSTGAHLHYETRLNGEPVDPTRFLSAGRLVTMADAAAR